ncbi:trypsin-like peptidase domain-containing protein [Candidatus Woesearchaeota archaeon]|nr:trypsin-like peptidase domain-containing protein [Candidatus Woesearchaeota archaeon]
MQNLWAVKQRVEQHDRTRRTYEHEVAALHTFSRDTFLSVQPNEYNYLNRLETRLGLSGTERAQRRLHALETLLLDASNGQYDYAAMSLTPEKVMAMTSPAYKLMNEATYEHIDYVYDEKGTRTEKRKLETKRYIGTGVIIKKAENRLLVLTAKHVFEPDPVPAEKKDEKGNIIYSSKLIAHKVLMVRKEVESSVVSSLPLTLVKNSKTADVSLLEATVAAEDFDSFVVAPPLGNSEELAPGHLIYLVGFPMGIAKIYSNGIVLSTGNPDKAWDDKNFYTNATSNPGNSGGPAYALRDGKPELVGILSWGIRNSQGLHGPVRVKYVKELLADPELPAYFK